jgi:hypothetical protein
MLLKDKECRWKISGANDCGKYKFQVSGSKFQVSGFMGLYSL